ncbi:hypothetical protein GGR53DRAFT_465898 [Hypoxylon sp. FL1150]|nr:hypothetical protein GGR53DRAFT_465898 [Hypoxylon sp. FL1150]
MELTTLALALTSLFARANAAAVYKLSNEPSDPLTPWQVTKLSTFSPSGRPGSSPLASILANITNPSSIPAGAGPSFAASSANYSVEWAFGDAQPYGTAYECTTTPAASASSSRWTVEILKTDADLYAPTERLDVRFTLTLTSGLAEDGSMVLAAIQHFEVGDNMRGTCGGSGVCSWSLDEELTPLLIQPAIVA